MKDFVIDFDAKTLFKDGDINTGESDRQNQRLLLVCEKGSFKEFPATGVGASTYLEDESADALIREVRTQFVADGQTVNKIEYKDGQIKVDAKY